MHRWRRNQRGAAAVEFALVAPVLLLFVFGIIEFSRLIALHSAINTSGREAARYGSTTGLSGSVPRYLDCNGIRDAARKLNKLANLASSDITVTYDRGPGTATIGSCAGSPPSPDPIRSGDRIIVTVRTKFHTGVPFLSAFLDGREVTSTNRRTINEVSS